MGHFRFILDWGLRGWDKVMLGRRRTRLLPIVGLVTSFELSSCAGSPVDDCKGDTCGPPTFGRSCDSAHDCRGDEVCLDDESGAFAGESPAGGLCTIPCNKGAEACPAGSRCVEVSSDDKGGEEATAVCLAECEPGGQLRCPKHPHAVCSQRVSERDCTGPECDEDTGICRPLCVVNEDCPSPSRCNVATGFCTDASATSTVEFGAECSPNDAAACPGLCLYGPTETFSFCTHSCRYAEGNDTGGYCAYAEERPVGYCGLPSSAEPSTGDEGFCAVMCEGNDCPEGTHCVPQPTESRPDLRLCLPAEP